MECTTIKSACSSWGHPLVCWSLVAYMLVGICWRTFAAIHWHDHRRVTGTQHVCYMCLALFHALGVLEQIGQFLVREVSREVSVDTLSAPQTNVFLRYTCRVNSRSWSWKRPFCTSCAAKELAVTGHFPVCNVDLPVSLFSVCHALLLESVKSIDDTVSFHLCRRFSSKTLSSDVAV